MSIELDGLSVTFGTRPILKGLRTRLEHSSIGLLGPNGAGKTTLLHTLLGFHAPSSGTARVFGHDVRTESAEIRRLTGYMPENDSFIAGMTAVRFVRLMAELAGLPCAEALERAHEALFYVGLGEARYRRIETFSLGMKQSVKLAQAIVHGPRLLVLDEPTNGLDPPHRQRMLELIREIRERGNMHLILSTHLLKDAEESCEEVIVLKQGTIAAQCDLAAERAANRRMLEIETVGDAEAFARGAAALGCELATTARRRLRLVLPDGVEVRDLYRVAAEHDVQLRRLDMSRHSLEEIFLAAVGDADGRV